MTDKPIQNPARFAPSTAIGFAAADGRMVLASEAAPLPVAPLPTGRPPALEGTASGSAIAGPFAPAPGLAAILTLSGEWDGTVAVERSTDGGATRHPLTVGGMEWGRYSANVCEPVWEESEPGAQLYLDVALTSGTLAYRVAQ